MTTIDSAGFLQSEAGYLQKGKSQNVRNVDLGEKVSDMLPSRYYRDEKIFSLEKRSLFSTLWHVASFKGRFTKPGTYVNAEMFGWKFFLIMDSNGNINAFHNVCRHRGFPVVQKSCGSSQFLSCKFHGWTYKPDGTLHKAREYTNLDDFDPKQHSLFKIHTHVTQQGFIFVNFDSRETPGVSFEDQFGDDFEPAPTSATGKVIGDEFALFNKDEYVYEETWNSAIAGTKFNWKTYVDGFQECYHCLTGHPTTLPKDFDLNKYYLRQGYGASRHYLPTKEGIAEAYITWLWPIGFVTFSENLLFIGRFNAKGALETSYESETYIRKSIARPSPQFDVWEEEVRYWRFVESEDVELAVAAQQGFTNGILGKGRIHPTQEHAVKWYQDKVKDILSRHAELEQREGKNIDYAIPQAQSTYEEGDTLCKIMGPEYEF